MKSKSLQKGNMLIIVLIGLVVLAIALVLSLKFLELGPFKTSSVSTTTTGQNQPVTNESDEVSQIEKDLNETSVAGDQTEIDSLNSDLQKIK